ncbi:MAG: hypothetical protein KAW92_06695 [Candidatus Cloacimonetes bacterium]|nr:hypothetical protein [Candidatus Cloacimonadota bacterium]
MSLEKELLQCKKDIELLTNHFVKGTWELYLPTDETAMFKQKVLEVVDLLDDIFGENNFYTTNIFHTINTSSKGHFGGPSFACVKDVVALINAAHKKYMRNISKKHDSNSATNRQNYVELSRINELKSIKNPNYDLTRLIRLCEELNIAYQYHCFMSIAMIMRAIIDHIPPIFGVRTFVQLASNYNNGKSFKKLMMKLENSLRNIANSHLHKQIGKREVLPTFTQVNFSAELDVLLSEIIKILK